MLTLESAQPRAELRRYIRAYAERKTGLSDPVVVEPVPTQLEQILSFEFGCSFDICHTDTGRRTVDKVSLAGSQSRFAAEIHLSGGIQSFGIFFRPTGCSELFGVPVCKLTDQFYEGTSVLGHIVRMLWNMLGECSCFNSRVEISERFLMHYAARANAKAGTTAAAERLFAMRGAMRITNLAEQSSTSLRQFERNFRRELGLSPKAFARIARFQGALDAKVARPARTWIEIAHAFGYHDQMHMIHDFEALGRDSPSRLLARLGDVRPPALAAAE